MIAYNKQSLDNLSIQETARKALFDKYIDQAAYDRIIAAHPVSFYMPNIFARVGLYILTWVAVLFAWGLVGLLLFTSINEEEILYGIAFLFAIAGFFMLELFIREKKLFRAGIDDALLLSSCVALTGALHFIYRENGVMIAATVCIVSLLATARYADRLMASICYISFLAAVFLAMMPEAMAAIPFTLMGISLAGYFACRKMLKSFSLRHYSDVFTIVSILSLCSFYVAGNFYAVKTLAPVVPLPGLFWALTLVTPLVFIYLGLRKKDVILLRSGLIYIAAAVLTVRYFHSVLPLASAMIVAGLVLVALSWWLIRYLKTPKNGFTYEPLAYPSATDKLNISGLIISQTFGGTHQPSGGDVQFGGGSGGGGGASGDY
jgi:uncharacterized membrane protein YgcG